MGRRTWLHKKSDSDEESRDWEMGTRDERIVEWWDSHKDEAQLDMDLCSKYESDGTLEQSIDI